MNTYIVIYEYTDDSEGRDKYRPAHKDYLAHLGEQGVNRVSGPFGRRENPGAAIIVRAESKEKALRATADDPFRVEGLVRQVLVYEWEPMLGPLAVQI